MKTTKRTIKQKSDLKNVFNMKMYKKTRTRKLENKTKTLKLSSIFSYLNRQLLETLIMFSGETKNNLQNIFENRILEFSSLNSIDEKLKNDTKYIFKRKLENIEENLNENKQKGEQKEEYNKKKHKNYEREVEDRNMEQVKPLEKIAILTNGGDAPGLNAVIRAIVKMGERHGVECYGYIDGFRGILENNYIKLDSKTNAKGLLTKGGTIIGSSTSANLFRYKTTDREGNQVLKDMSEYAIHNIKNAGFDCVFALGGDGTQKSSRDFSKMGVNFIGIPKTIDNDVAKTDKTFGFDTAVAIATDALEKLETTAASHDRIMVLEVMGRYTGWIALHSGIAGGADVILIPEIPFDIHEVANKIYSNQKKGKNFSVIVVSEGATFKGEDIVTRNVSTEQESSGLDNVRLGGIGEQVANRLEKITGVVARNTTLGYVQRGGSPISTDRILATSYGIKAMDLALKGIFGVLVTYTDGDMGYVPLDDVVGDNTEIGAPSKNNTVSNIKKVSLNNELITVGKELGICFGN